MVAEVINAAGKLTALGGSAQSLAVAAAQSEAAQRNIEISALRAEVSAHIATLCGAEAACLTSGAAAGTVISVAACITGNSLELASQLPQTEDDHRVLLQAGHDVNYGAPVEQMIRLGGGVPWIVGSTNLVSERLLLDTLDRGEFTALMYVQSHHCVQANQVGFERCVEICQRFDVPVIVDAAAEEDLQRYIAGGADLVTYSGGKAFSGPTSGFIVGNRLLIEACELQYQGIARAMKVGKEAIAGLAVALDEYISEPEEKRLAQLNVLNERLHRGLTGNPLFDIRLIPDEAGRPFDRLAVSFRSTEQDIRQLVRYLSAQEPSIRTRNHHLDEGYLLIDPRELKDEHVSLIVAGLNAFPAVSAEVSGHAN